MIVPDDLELRWGRDPHYLNVDVGGHEVGHLVVDDQGHAFSSWATRALDRPLIQLIARIVNAAARRPS